MPRIRNRTVVLIATLASLAHPMGRSATAGENPNPRFILHGLSPTTKNVCARPANVPTQCQGYNAGISGLALNTPWYVYLIVTDRYRIYGSIGGAQFGITYSGGVDASGGLHPVNVFSWTRCSTLEFPSATWPAPGSGNLVTWSSTSPQCTAPPISIGVGNIAVSGYFYLTAYQAALMSVTPRPVDHKAALADCGGHELIHDGFDPYYFGSIGFGMPGHNPCEIHGGLPVVADTWSGVKRLVD